MDRKMGKKCRGQGCLRRHAGRSEKAALLSAALLAGLLCGCSRSQMNYQIAECIGTLNQYENNEPVETPKMKAEREQRESESELAQQQEEQLEEAAALAQGYYYEEALALLQNSEILQEDERAQSAITEYQDALDNMYEYTGNVGNLCFTSLVADTDRAFDGDGYEEVYRQNMITLTEFENILETLYRSGYVLIDIHSLASLEISEDGQTTMTAEKIMMPEGKRPLVFSVENLNYASARSADGMATKLALDADGNVGAVYVDAQGHEYTGAYDTVPVLEAFIQEHPDFSYRGARGVIGLSGENGIFGYQIEESTTIYYEKNVQTVQEIAQKLKEDGWTFACQGYCYQSMRDLSYDALLSDLQKWQDTVGTLIGDCDTMLYPYGSEVDVSSEKGAYVRRQGFRYLIGLWAEGDHLEVNSEYLRQTRRNVTGYIFENYPNIFDSYFSTASILDPAR